MRGKKMAHLLEKTKRTSILKRTRVNELPYNAITRQLADIIDCNAFVLWITRDVSWITFMRYKTNNDRVEQLLQPKTPSLTSMARRGGLWFMTRKHLPVEHDFDYFPIDRADFQRWVDDHRSIHNRGFALGSLIIWRNDKKFEWVIPCRIAAQPRDSARDTSVKEDEKNIRRRTAVTMKVNTAFYSNFVPFQLF